MVTKIKLFQSEDFYFFYIWIQEKKKKEYKLPYEKFCLFSFDLNLKIIIFHFHTVKFQQDLLNKKSFHISNMLDPYIHRQNQVENSWASVTQMGRIFAIYPTNLWDFPPKKCSVLPNDRSPSVLMLMCSELISQGSKEVTGSQNLLGVFLHGFLQNKSKFPLFLPPAKTILSASTVQTTSHA